ncbi:hypothetical protein BDR26DRAFT_875666 [Obelidium mucronatum]|nr:hypothetical protein BDR26DRAFT_875666 [Obelidium mucronatum]
MTTEPESIFDLLSLLIRGQNQLQSDIKQIQSNQESLSAAVVTLTNQIASLPNEASTLVTLNQRLESYHSNLNDAIARSNRDLSLQMLKLQNPTTKFYTRITHLPTETVHEIFSWISPKQVVRFRRLSRAFNSFLISKGFAKMNLNRFVAVSAAIATSKQETETTTLNQFDEMLFFLPKSFQYYYTEAFLWRLEGIDWYRGHVGKAFIPKALCSLKFLKRLNLSQCRLKGGIIPELSHLTSCVVLNLSYNFLSGQIPKEIYSMTQLTVLSLKSNELVGAISPAIGNLCNLTQLDLSDNPGSVPNELGVKTCLVLPRELGKLVLVQELFVANEVVGWECYSDKAQVGNQLVNLVNTDIHTIPIYYDY